MKGGSLTSEKGANVAGQTRGNGHHAVPEFTIRTLVENVSALEGQPRSDLTQLLTVQEADVTCSQGQSVAELGQNKGPVLGLCLPPPSSPS